jgi:hypothetical protein
MELLVTLSHSGARAGLYRNLSPKRKAVSTSNNDPCRYVEADTLKLSGKKKAAIPAEPAITQSINSCLGVRLTQRILSHSSFSPTTPQIRDRCRR